MVAAADPEVMSTGTLVDVFFTRVWWTADVERDGDRVLLRVRRGARHVAIWRSTLEVFDDRVEQGEPLRSAVGDRFVVCGPSVEETTVAKVVAVECNALAIELRTELAESTTTVQLTKLALRRR